MKIQLHPTPPSPKSSSSKLERRHTGRLRKRDNLLMGEREEPNHTTAQSSINQSIFSGESRKQHRSIIMSSLLSQVEPSYSRGAVGGFWRIRVSNKHRAQAEHAVQPQHYRYYTQRIKVKQIQHKIFPFVNKIRSSSVLRCSTFEAVF